MTATREKHTPQPDGIRGDLYALSHFSEEDAASTLKEGADYIGQLEREKADLLAALESAIATMAEHEAIMSRTGGGNFLRQEILKARTAIAKAKGE